MSVARTSRAPAKDQVLSGAVETARSAAEDVAVGGHVGEHQGFELLADRVGTHFFASAVPGYQGWRWAVTVARVPRGRRASVSEVELVPGDGALLAPQWVPWAERLRPGDLGAGDVLPFVKEDARLEQGWEFTGDEEDAAEAVIHDLGLGRARVLSRKGREEAMERWYDGDSGPNAPAAKNAAGPCVSCAFFLPMAGSARRLFGVCANEWSPDDGRVVSVDHGCGAHSETHEPEPAPLWDAAPPVHDEMDLIVLPPLNPEPEPGPAADEAAEAEPAPEPDAEADAEPAPDAEPASVAESTPDVETAPDAEPEPEARPAVDDHDEAGEPDAT
ncbi:MAG: DUF3027 domain-containing protein [Actinomycetaceae bacterium]